MTSKDRTVIVGAGHGGAVVAALLRDQGYRGEVILVTDEDLAPYQRPPLSKQLLTRVNPQPLTAVSAYEHIGIDLRLSCRVDSIDAGLRTVRLAPGETLTYASLVLATGAVPRQLPLPGMDLDGVLQLRSFADSRRLASRLHPGKRLVVIGGGWIGLEVAAAVRAACDVDVMVLEREERMLSRVASAELAAYVCDVHRAHGTQLMTGVEVRGVVDRGDGAVGAVAVDDRTVACDVVLVAVGVRPRDELARAAGLSCDNGVLVDSAGRTSDPRIFAVGDVTCRPVLGGGLLVRIESIPSATEQARQVASAIVGSSAPALEVPWFWSEQFGRRIQLAGLPPHRAHVVRRGEPAADSFALLHYVDGVLAAAEAVNASAEFLRARKAIGTDRADLGTTSDTSPGLDDPEDARTSPRGEAVANVRFVLPDGGVTGIRIPYGRSLMEGAVTAEVPGIVAECGGSLTCGTCHVYVDHEWRDRLPEPNEFERETLEFVSEPSEASRLSCQVIVTPDIDGLVVRVPEAQC